MDTENELLAMLETSAGQFIAQQLDSKPSTEALWQGMADVGWLGIALPESHGGLGLGLEAITSLSRLFGQSAFTTRLIGQAVMPAVLLAAVEDNHPALASLTETLVSGENTLAVAWQEAVGNAQPVQMGSELVAGKLNGKKRFVAGADSAAHFLVSCQMGGSTAVVLVSRTATGVAVNLPFESNLGFGELTLTDVAVNDNALLLTGDAANTALATCIQYGQVALAAELEGMASGCLAKTVDFLQTRKQFNQALGSFQAIRHRCADLLIGTRLAQSSWRRAVADYRPESTNLQIHAAKARCADAAFNVAKEAIQMHGAMGFTEEAGIGNYMRGAISLGSWLGSPQQHRQQLLKISQGELCGHV